MHILLIEDDLALGSSLQKILHLELFTSEWVRNSSDANQFITHNDYDCVLLDLSLPDGNGMQLLRSWRQSGITTPIIVITAQSALEMRLAGLDGGADDFMLKPFVPVELIARINAVVRRYARQSHETWSIGRLEIKPKSHQVKLEGQILDLTRREFAILLELARDCGTVISKNSLAERLEPLGEPVDLSTIEVHVSNLRRKIGSDLIKTVRGIGYMLNGTSSQ